MAPGRDFWEGHRLQSVREGAAAQKSFGIPRPKRICPAFFLAFGRAIIYVHLNTISPARPKKAKAAHNCCPHPISGRAVRQFFDILKPLRVDERPSSTALALRAEQRRSFVDVGAQNPRGEFCASTHFPQKNNQKLRMAPTAGRRSPCAKCLRTCFNVGCHWLRQCFR